MSYPYPFEVFDLELSSAYESKKLWGSFSPTKPKEGEIIEAPDGSYRVVLVHEGKHLSMELLEEFGSYYSGQGWFWYGPRVTSNRLST